MQLEALLLALATAAAAGLVGCFAVMRRMALASDAISHVALPGIGLALLFNLHPLIGALAALAAGVWLIWALEEQTRIPTDTIIGVVFSAALAIGAMMTSGDELVGMLFGRSQPISTVELAFSLLAAGRVVTFMLRERHQLVVALVSPDMARTSGVNVRRLNFGFLLMFALTVALGLRHLGVLLMGSLIIIPAATARRLAANLSQMLAISTVIAITTTVAGFALAPRVHKEPGPVIVTIAATVFALTFFPETLMLTTLVGGMLLLLVSTTSQLPAAEDVMLARLAIELAADRDAAPISLDPDGSSLHGVVYDRFAGAHLAARVAKLKGTPFDPASPPASLLNRVVVVVAVPLVCGERTVRPTDVDITDLRSNPVPKWQPATGATIQKLLPGAVVPAGAIAVQFSDSVLRQGEVVKVSYASPVCSGTSRTESFRVIATDSRPLKPPTLEMPPGEKAPAGGITLNIKGVVDLNGELRYANAPEASTPFGARAMDAARAMRFEPARINRSPTPWTSGIILTFGVSGAAAGDTTTKDAAGLTAATSKCPVSADANYGVTGSFAIRIGGGPDGAARIERFMQALRGPAGQGLDYRSAGKSLMRGRITAVLEGFEVRYAGLTEPVRIYFDTTNEEPVLAPKGFTCAAALR